MQGLSIYVVSADGLCFHSMRAMYLNADELSKDELSILFGDSDSDRASLAKRKRLEAAAKGRFVSRKLMYEIPGYVLDKERPEYKYFVPLCSGRIGLVDCWVVNDKGQAHPNYSYAGVPVLTEGLQAVGEVIEQD